MGWVGQVLSGFADLIRAFTTASHLMR